MCPSTLWYCCTTKDANSRGTYKQSLGHSASPSDKKFINPSISKIFFSSVAVTVHFLSLSFNFFICSSLIWLSLTSTSCGRSMNGLINQSDCLTSHLGSLLGEKAFDFNTLTSNKLSSTSGSSQSSQSDCSSVSSFYFQMLLSIRDLHSSWICLRCFPLCSWTKQYLVPIIESVYFASKILRYTSMVYGLPLW